MRSRPACVPCGPAAQLPRPPAPLAAAASMVGSRVRPSVLGGGSRVCWGPATPGQPARRGCTGQRWCAELPGLPRGSHRPRMTLGTATQPPVLCTPRSGIFFSAPSPGLSFAKTFAGQRLCGSRPGEVVSRGNRKTDFPLTQKDWSRLKLSGVGSCQPRLGPQGRRSDYEINLDKLVKC